MSTPHTVGQPDPDDLFSYGNITLSYVHTVRLEESAVYDDSGVDYLYTKVTLTVAGLLGPGYGGYRDGEPDVAHAVPPALVGEKPADVLARLEHELMVPRRKLRYRVGGTTVFSVDPPLYSPNKGEFDANPGAAVVPGALAPNSAQRVGFATAIDCDHGPKPVSVATPVGVTEGGIVVEFTVTFCVATCNRDLAKLAGIASHRYEVEESHDECGYVTRKTTGLAVRLSGLGDGNAAADDDAADRFRGLLVPPVPQGYERASSRWWMAKDGLKLRYEAVDVEQYVTPPELYPNPDKNKPRNQQRAAAPLKCDGQLVAASGNTGVNWTGLCVVSLEGGKTVGKARLMAQAIKIVFNMLTKYAYKADNARAPMQQVSLKTDLYKNRVEASARITLDATKLRFGEGARNVSLAIFTQVPADSAVRDQPGFAPPARGALPLVRMIAAEYRDPCVVNLAQKSGLKFPSGPLEYPKQRPGWAQVEIVDELPTPAPYEPFKDAPYTHYGVSVQYESDSGRKTMTSTSPARMHPVVALHQPTLDLMVSWSATRIGQAPDIPDPNPPYQTFVEDDPPPGGWVTSQRTRTSNFVLKKQVITADQVDLMPAGAWRWTIAGVYWYAVRRPEAVPLVSPLSPEVVADLLAELARYAAPPPLPPLPGGGPYDDFRTPKPPGAALPPPPPPSVAYPAAGQYPFGRSLFPFWWRMFAVRDTPDFRNPPGIAAAAPPDDGSRAEPVAALDRAYAGTLGGGPIGP